MNQNEQRAELRRFLKDRRARLTPAEVGLAAIGRRRVSGLRREEVAMIAGIGVSWYTALESGNAEHVSEATVRAVSEALRLSESERAYVLALTGHAPVRSDGEEPSILLVETMHALAYPAYIIDPFWDVLAFNAAFRRVWNIADDEVRFNAVERMFLHPAGRVMHGDRFIENITPVIAMLRSAVGRRAYSTTLQRIREQLIAEPDLRKIWDAYEISDPLTPNTCTIQSTFGPFVYQALTLKHSAETIGLVVHIPDHVSRERLRL
jgi:transcriptional regulator with XRE-family HTH domain